jgi:NAD(P)-dependent dehydrogenase (short-subunit alcohol dehydrogenase family)
MDPLTSSSRLKLENQVAVVTGGARGIGAAIVRRFVEEGSQVVFSDVLTEKGKALEVELGQKVAFYRADATNSSDCEALMNFTVERFGSLNCVVNNAGAGAEGGPIANISVEGFDRAMALLLRGPFLGMKYAVPHMKSGTIINIASVAGLAGGYGSHAYTAAKFGIVGLTKSVALELAERGIRVNAICPGGIATAIFSRLFPADMPADLIERAPEEIVAPWLADGIPLGKAGFPADIASAALWLASIESSFVTGHALVVDGGLTSGTSWSRMRQRYEALVERCQAAMGETTVSD